LVSFGCESERWEKEYCMAYEDRKMTCADCGAEFTFTAGEQQFYAERGYTNPPKRCPKCRQERRRDKPEGQAGGGARGGEGTIAVCADCGKETKLPFKPTGTRPVYCSDCFRKRRQQSRS
jgi:CxxC-x17-CxxC domain-containing protein